MTEHNECGEEIVDYYGNILHVGDTVNVRGLTITGIIERFDEDGFVSVRTAKMSIGYEPDTLVLVHKHVAPDYRKARITHVDATSEEITPRNGQYFTDSELRDILQTDLSIYQAGKNTTMICGEHGATNFIATATLHALNEAHKIAGTILHGDVLLIPDDQYYHPRNVEAFII